MGKRSLRFECEADVSLRSFERMLKVIGDPLIEKTAGDLYKLIFLILPDCGSRGDFKPISIGKNGKFHTTYKAAVGEIMVKYSATPYEVIIHTLELPKDVLVQMSMVA